MALTNPFEINPQNYKYGMKGDQIVSLQEALVFAGYDVGTIDGVFGQKTKDACEQFEIDHAYNNTLSFAVDIRTLTMLFNQVCIDTGPTPPPPEPPVEPPIEPPVEPPTNIDVPKGKGMFVRSLTGTGTVENMKQYIQANGIDWICVQRMWQHDDHTNYLNGDSWSDYKEAGEEAGCDLWIWGWPIPEGIDDYVQEMSDTASSWGAIGIIIDAEGPWYNEGAAATDLIDKMMAIGLPIGLTSYGAPWYHSTFPFEEFSKANFGVPQIYDSENSMPDDYPTRSVQEWNGLGYAHVVPASSAYKSPAGMEDLLSRTPTPDDSIMWWDWFNANLDQGRWTVIGEYEIQTSLAAVLAQGNT